jgi:hypothetical protein
MKKTAPKEIIKRVKAKHGSSSRMNVTFRLPIDLTEKFQKACKTNGVKPTHVIEELLIEFLGEQPE